MSRADQKTIARAEAALRRMFQGAYRADAGLEPPLEVEPLDPESVSAKDLLGVCGRRGLAVGVLEDPDRTHRRVVVLDLHRLPEFVAEYVAASPVLMSQKIRKAYARRHGLDVRAIAPEDHRPKTDDQDTPNREDDSWQF